MKCCRSARTANTTALNRRPDCPARRDTDDQANDRNAVQIGGYSRGVALTSGNAV